MTSASRYSDQGKSGEVTQIIEQELPISAGPSEIEHSSLSAQQAGQLSTSKSAIHLHGHAPAGDQVRVFVSQAALQQIDAHAQSDLDREVGGVLMGHLREGESHLSIEVLAALPAVSDDHGPVHFTFTADAWARIHEDRSDQYPDLQIVGWFHTHPDLDVFYSSDDVVVHSAAFVMPWQVGLVVDPIRLKGCLFGWRVVEHDMTTQPELIPINGYYERLDERPASITTWKLVRSTIWQDSYMPGGGEYAHRDLYMPDNPWPALPPISPWWGVALGGLSLLISLILLLDRLLASAGG